MNYMLTKKWQPPKNAGEQAFFFSPGGVTHLCWRGATKDETRSLVADPKIQCIPLSNWLTTPI